MQRQAITIGLFFLNAIWFSIFMAASTFNFFDFVDIARAAAWLSFFVAVGHLLFPYRTILTRFFTRIRNWWSRNI